LGNAFKARYELENAEKHYRHAIRLQPDYAPPYYNLGLTLGEQNRFQEAVACYQQALEFNPNYVEAHSNLGDMFKEQHRLAEAEACYRTALRINPNYMEAHNNLGILLKDQGRFSEAEQFYRAAISLQPDARTHSNLLFTYTYDAERDAKFYLAEAKNYGEKVAQKVSQTFTTWQCEPQPARLRVGLVSGDFWNHPVGYFLENLLAHLDTAKLELMAYPTIHRNDALTQRIQPYFSQWKSLVGLTDEAAARLIQADAVHILVDLSGHTAKNRLPVFAWKPAPIQISWLGYWATTGVAEMDYILVDEVGVPEQNHWHFSEKVRYLPDTRLCFSAPKMDIAVSILPALSKGYVTFGCFQNLTKVTDAVLAVWGKIFAQLPTARLRLQSKQLSDEQFTEQFFARLKAVDIAAYRVDIQSFTDREAYFAAHAEVDFILDSFPFTGGTTTCEALWMGVPTLTLAGETLVARQGASLLSAAGLPEWVVENEQDYIKQAIVFATDLDVLAQLRSHLREQVLASPLFDGQRFAKNFENTLWQLWREKKE
jgi:protein O-GlcNAc transferase